MTTPERALATARTAAAAALQEGEDLGARGELRVEPAEAVDEARLLEWAILEADMDMVRSTRRWGKPITAAKRGLVHALRQYLGQLTGQQTRFNHHLLLYASRLEDRVSELERRVARLERRGPPEPGAGEPGARAR